MIPSQPVKGPTMRQLTRRGFFGACAGAAAIAAGLPAPVIDEPPWYFAGTENMPPVEEMTLSGGRFDLGPGDAVFLPMGFSFSVLCLDAG